MTVKLEDRMDLIARAKYLMNKYSFTVFEAIKWAEQELEQQIKIEEE